MFGIAISDMFKFDVSIVISTRRHGRASYSTIPAGFLAPGNRLSGNWATGSLPQVAIPCLVPLDYLLRIKGLLFFASGPEVVIFGRHFVLKQSTSVSALRGRSCHDIPDATLLSIFEMFANFLFRDFSSLFFSCPGSIV